MKSKIVSLLCTVLCVVNIATPVLATEYSSPTDNAEVPLTFTKESYFTVSLPEAITGSKGATSVDFIYSVEGDIEADKMVTVVPEDENSSAEGYQLELSDVTNNTIEADVTVPKTEFKYDEIYTLNTQQGTVSVLNLPAGQWEGICNFLIDLKTSNVEKSAGLYDAEGNLLCNWEDSGINIEKDYGGSSGSEDYYKTTESSPYYVLSNDYPTATTVIVPEGVSHIGNETFDGCGNLSNIMIPDTVTSIGDWAFQGTDLSSINIPESVSSLGKGVFYKCTNLSSLTIPSNVKEIKDKSFYGCTNLSSVVMSEGLSSIGDWAFYECTNLSSIVMPEGLTTLGNSVFSSCSSLSSINIPNSVSSMGNSVFSGCKSLLSIEIPSSINTLGNNVFGNSGLTSVVIPDSITSIKTNMFYNCKNLSSISLPVSIKEIEYKAFYGCSSLTSISIPKEVSLIDTSAFMNCTNLSIIIVDSNNINYKSVEGILYSFDMSTLICYPMGKSESTYSVLDSVTKIESNAFYGCTNLSTIVLPDSVATIEDNAFINNNYVYYRGSADVSTCGAKKVYSGWLCDIDGNILCGITATDVQANRFTSANLPQSKKVDKTQVVSVVLPKETNKIGNMAFNGCTNLSNIVIPDTVTSIGEASFQNCNSLESVSLPNSISSIEGYAFFNCTNLNTLFVPDNVSSIGDYAFCNVPHIYYNGIATGSPWGAKAIN